MAHFTENQVHEYLYEVGIDSVIQDCPLFDSLDDLYDVADIGDETEESEPIFELWRLIKQRAFEKLDRLHQSIKFGSFIGSKIKLPIDSTRPMELDLLGTHEEGIFVLELKVNKSAERNAFSELFAYSNYLASVFALSGHQDIANVLVANLDAKITKQAFLYDLIINDRDVIVYHPTLPSGELNSLALDLYLPSDEDFEHFTNDLLSHDAMACVVISFEDNEGWFDSSEEGGSLNAVTKSHLSMLSNYTAQLMESERLHGFCFVRKPWQEIPRYYRNSLFVCALNPFRIANPGRVNAITSQIAPSKIAEFFDMPEMGFDGRLIRIAKRAVSDCLTQNIFGEAETPLWSEIVKSTHEVVFTHNFAFRPTGIFRESYVSFINDIYEREAAGQGWGEDVSILKINEINNWFRAWEFMRACGLAESFSLDSEQ